MRKPELFQLIIWNQMNQNVTLFFQKVNQKYAYTSILSYLNIQMRQVFNNNLRNLTSKISK